MLSGRLVDDPSMYDACYVIGSKLDFGSETQPKQSIHDQIDTGRRQGPTSAELRGIKNVKPRFVFLKTPTRF